MVGLFAMFLPTDVMSRGLCSRFAGVRRSLRWELPISPLVLRWQGSGGVVARFRGPMSRLRAAEVEEPGLWIGITRDW